MVTVKIFDDEVSIDYVRAVTNNSNIAYFIIFIKIKSTYWITFVCLSRVTSHNGASDSSIFSKKREHSEISSWTGLFNVVGTRPFCSQVREMCGCATVMVMSVRCVSWVCILSLPLYPVMEFVTQGYSVLHVYHHCKFLNLKIWLVDIVTTRTFFKWIMYVIRLR